MLAVLSGLRVQEDVFLLRPRPHLVSCRHEEPIAFLLALPRCGGRFPINAHDVLVDPVGDWAADRPDLLTAACLQCTAFSRERGRRLLPGCGYVVLAVLAHSRAQHSG